MTDQNLTNLRGVGEAAVKKLHALGLFSYDDIVSYFPRRYEDYSIINPISELRPGPVTIQATLSRVSGRYVRRGLHITEATAGDNSGNVRITWFNQPYRAQSIKKGAEYYISGEFGLHYQSLNIVNPSAELVSEFPVNTARIVPIYRETKGFTSKQIRKIIRELVPYIREKTEVLPNWLVQNYRLQNYAEAIETIHFPKTSGQLDLAKNRIAFQEVFELILASLLLKQALAHEPAVTIPFDEKVAKTFVSNLPFKLTDAQRLVVWQILKDMQKTTPMNRLVEGDVGSGKTVVAAMAAVLAANYNHQTALMAPTELLARQHAESLYALLEPIGMSKTVVLLVGGMKPTEKARARAAIADGSALILVGTHALIQESVDMHRLALVVIDEQHRFGVEQRKKLMAKSGCMPHVLSLTATPIPRSLALTVYGELDVSIIDSKPAGRQPIKTEIISPNSRKQVYEKVDTELAAGRQMFVVCPIITESSGIKARSVEVAFDEMKRSFKKRSIGLLHGKLKPEAKNKIMEQFVNHEIDILVSTTVIEVGVDVPNASIMMIESAERFGLAQIHQLRGRVGRGGHRGFCYLMMSDSSAPSKRLLALQSSNDGFKLAELDLKLRGPGAIYGTMQHGALDLRMASLTDVSLIASARKAAQEFIDRNESLLQYPVLAAKIAQLQKITKLN